MRQRQEEKRKGGRDACMQRGREGMREKEKRETTEGSKVDERMGDQICEPEEVEAA